MMNAPVNLKPDPADRADDVQASLEKPGAGIPWLESKLLGSGLRLFARRSDRAGAWRKFADEAEQLLMLAEALDEAGGRRRVLVSRGFGMEDSSRFWSPYMILQHVTIVDRGVLMLIRALMAGKSPEKQTSTADLKPSPDAGPESIGVFRETVESWRRHLADLGDLKTSARKDHSWFGSLDAHQWFCLAGIHHGIHRKQLERVLTGVGRS
jgi:hypothetical protein